MNPIRTSAVLVLAAALLPVQAQQPSIRTTAEEVVLDVIVRDKKGRTIKDLASGDLEVLDNGQKREIKSFRLVEGKEAITGTGRKELDPLRQVRLVTLLFERLGQNGRRLAREAALDLIKDDQQNVYYAVMVLDQQLNALQAFTTDRTKLKAAIERATGGQFTGFAEQSTNIRKALEQQVGPRNGQSVVEAVQNKADSMMSPSGNPSPAGFADAKAAEVLLQMLQFSDMMAREQEGRSSIFPLLAMVRAQMPLPGRKTVVYFSEGFRMPAGLKDDFDSLIGAANRANVSVYSVDARGLQTTSDSQAGMDELRGAMASSARSSRSLNGPVTADQAKAMDRAEDSMRSNTQNQLLILAESTGGALIGNTNDLRTPIKHISEDINSYYEITYNPGIETYDGRFRKIAVKVNRADARLQTRNGYFALPPSAVGTLSAYEMPMLSALSTMPLAKAFPFRSQVLQFRRKPDHVQCELVVDVPLKEMTFEQEKDHPGYHVHFSVLMLLKDATGNVIRKVSQDVPSEVPPDKLENFRAGNFIFTRHFDVAPGRYTLETAVMDRRGQKVSAKRAVLMALAPNQSVGLSNLTLIRRVEAQTKPDTEDPLDFAGGKVTPSLNDTVPGGKGAALSLYFVVYPVQGADKPKMKLELLKDGKAVGGGTPELPAPDAQGAIPYIATLPIETLEQGQYEVRVTVQQGAGAVQQTTMFIIG